MSEHKPSRIRITLTDGSRVEMEHPELTGDTLIGRIRKTVTTGEGPASESSTTERVLLSDVVRIETTHVSEAKTGSLVFGLAAIGALVAGGIALATWDGPLSGWGK